MLIPFAIHFLQTYLSLVAFVIHFLHLLFYHLPPHHVHVSTLLVKVKKEIKFKLAQGIIKTFQRLNKVPLATISTKKNNLPSPLSFCDTQKGIHVKINLNDIKVVAWPLGATNISFFMSPKHTYMIQIEKGNTKSHTCMQTFHHTQTDPKDFLTMEQHLRGDFVHFLMPTPSKSIETTFICLLISFFLLMQDLMITHNVRHNAIQ